MSRHGAIVLAAGRSRRLGQAKQRLIHQGQTLEQRAVALALATMPAELLLVRAADDCSALPTGALRCVRAPSGGMGRSLAAAVAASALPGTARLHAAARAADDSDADSDTGAWLILLVDQIGLQAAHLQALLALWRREPLTPVASRYAGTVGVPALLPWHWRSRLLELGADEGARAWLRNEPGLRTIDAPELALDLDDPASLARLR